MTWRRFNSADKEDEVILPDVNALLYALRADPNDPHWGIFKRRCIETDTTAALVSDASFAALANEWGGEWIALDRDYARFPGLSWPVTTGRSGARSQP